MLGNVHHLKNQLVVYRETLIEDLEIQSINKKLSHTLKFTCSQECWTHTTASKQVSSNEIKVFSLLVIFPFLNTTFYDLFMNTTTGCLPASHGKVFPQSVGLASFSTLFHQNIHIICLSLLQPALLIYI